MDPIGISYGQEALSTDLLDGWLKLDWLFHSEEDQESSLTESKRLYKKV